MEKICFVATGIKIYAEEFKEGTFPDDDHRYSTPEALEICRHGEKSKKELHCGFENEVILESCY